MEAEYRIAVLALLAALTGAVIYEGEKINRHRYQFRFTTCNESR